jgi:hypothetical protein
MFKMNEQLAALASLPSHAHAPPIAKRGTAPLASRWEERERGKGAVQKKRRTASQQKLWPRKDKRKMLFFKMTQTVF